MKISDITGAVGAFGDDCKTSFQGFRVDPANVTALIAWDAIHSHRINAAPLMPAQLSIADFEQFYSDSRRVLVAVARCLHFTPESRTIVFQTTLPFGKMRATQSKALPWRKATS
jgi:hypothetical protein